MADTSAQEGAATEGPRSAANPTVVNREITQFRQRLEYLRKEEQAWREKSATEKEMTVIRARIVETGPDAQDQDGKLQRDPRAGLGEAEFVGQVEVDTPWRIAPKDNATLVSFPAKS